MGEVSGPPVVSLPRPLDRRMRLGPFPSARDALKFAGYAAIGAFALPVGGALSWLPFLAGGFLLAVYRPQGRGLDERAAEYLRWRIRRLHPPSAPDARTPPGGPASVIRLPGPFLAAIVEAGGVPVRFLPPPDARELFDRYRELLRSIGGGFHLVAGTVPVPGSDFRPPTLVPKGEGESAARQGYVELVSLLIRRRRRRRVRFLLFERLASASALGMLEERARLAERHLASMGAQPERLTGAALRTAAVEMGWHLGGPG